MGISEFCNTLSRLQWVIFFILSLIFFKWFCKQVIFKWAPENFFVIVFFAFLILLMVFFLVGEKNVLIDWLFLWRNFLFFIMYHKRLHQKQVSLKIITVDLYFQIYFMLNEIQFYINLLLLSSLGSTVIHFECHHIPHLSIGIVDNFTSLYLFDGTAPLHKLIVSNILIIFSISVWLSILIFEFTPISDNSIFLSKAYRNMSDSINIK